MSQAWNDALQEFTAMTAALNAGALVRAGLLTEAERNSMVVMLAPAEAAARTPDQKAIVFSLHHLLAGPTTPEERTPGS